MNACYNDENIYPLVNISDNSVSLESSKTYPYLDIIYEAFSTLNEEQKESLDRALADFYNRNSRYRKMYPRLIEMKARIRFEINPKVLKPLGAKAGFASGKIMFLDSESIKIEYLLEEMIHAIQHYDVHGQAKMLSAKKNIEFEAKVLQDICIVTNPSSSGWILLGSFAEPRQFISEYEN